MSSGRGIFDPRIHETLKRRYRPTFLLTGPRLIFPCLYRAKYDERTF